jgi:uncharacterized RmlC-like cupin family protein
MMPSSEGKRPMSTRLPAAAMLLVGAGAAVVVLAAGPSSTMPEMRMTPAEVREQAFGEATPGTSGLAGVRTKTLFGDPGKTGLYTILLFVPAHTTIQAHSHKDDRMATVVTGTWSFGYGEHFAEAALKRLPPGSVYAEPGGRQHFAQTGDDPVVVQITGFGPTDTTYFNPADDPKKQPH